MTTTTLSLRVSEEMRAKLARLAEATDRPMNYHASAALEAYLDLQQWQVQGIRSAIAEADQNGAQVDQESVRAWVDSWYADAEKKPPR